MPTKLRLAISAAFALPAAALAAAAWWAPRAFEEELARPFSPREAAWTTSTSCLACHQDHHASWYRTFHRTMTQEATPGTVVGAFDGREVTYWGVTVRPVERQGRFFFDYLDPASGRLLRTVPVLRTVGSRRYQQYLGSAPEGGALYRLHLLWHIEDRRWVHMNGAFLGPDEQGFEANVAVWNHSCIFCHNTGPEPNSVNYRRLVARARRGEAVDFSGETIYDSRVAELGIACESCHGPAGEHAARNRNPLRRYLLHLSGTDDPTIVNPAKLSKERSVEVCGQCHGQRVPRSMEGFDRWVTEGPTYRSGEVLTDHVDPIWRQTPRFMTGEEGAYRLRFWSDGTPRLTAYEYQGLRQSACYLRGELTCISCHTMHDGDVFGQLPEAHRTAAACAPCHQDLVADAAGHSRHAAGSSGGSCYDCHLPRMVYGIMEIHRSHRIESPDPGASAAAARPDACTSCHLDRSPVWAAEASRRWWGERFAVPAERGDGADPAVVDAVASLLAGDPVQRAVAARLAGREGTPLSARQSAFLVPHLLLALDDGYPAVRRFAQKSLLSLEAELAADGVDPGFSPELAGFDFIAPRAARSEVLRRLARRWAALDKSGLPPPPQGSLLRPDYLPQREATQRLQRLAAARSKAIDIGE